MSSTLKEKKSFLDILQTQIDPIIQIPIKKIGFDKVKKPTELEPYDIEKENKFALHGKKKEKTLKPFSTPKPVIEYIVSLIKDKKLPLKALKWELEESTSIEEAHEHITRSKVLSTDDMKQADNLLGFHSYKALNIDPDDLNNKIIEAKQDYLNLLKEHGEVVSQKQVSFGKIMQSLGVEREMPNHPESPELSQARNEYLTLMDKKMQLTLREKNVSAKTDKILEKIGDEIKDLLI